MALVVAGEAWFRATQPFGLRDGRYEWVPGVGVHRVAHSEVRWTNRLDYWVVSRANSFGFLDREPLSPARARASCHVAIVGDSFVDAREVPLRDKMHVRLEEMTARRLPAADVTTTGWGRGMTGQIRQLAFWDKWIHRYSPKLVVLVFVDNDIADNAPLRSRMSASLDPGGRVVLRRPSSPRRSLGRPTWTDRFVQKGRDVYSRASFFVHVHMRTAAVLLPPVQTLQPDLPQFTAFALDQWLERAQRAGASLVILASHTMRTSDWALDGGESQFDWLAREAAKRQIPMVDQFDYIARNGILVSNAHWKYDHHWNPQGHQWAAEALLEWLEQNLWACGT